MRAHSIGILSFQGDVSEHIRATEEAGKRLKKNISVVTVRTKEDLENLDALIIPGGESTTLFKLCEREGMLPGMKKIPNIFGTCAGAIFLAERVSGKAEAQSGLEVMDITADRNAYGTQNDSFETRLDTKLGNIHAVFIRAPRIKEAGKTVSVLARNGTEIVACEEKGPGWYYLATAFHPELTTTLFHEHFLKNAV